MNDTSGPDPVLQSIVEAAIGATGATAGWIVTPDDERLAVRAAAGAGAAALVGRPAQAEGGTAAFALASGQPLALVLRPDDPRVGEGVPALLGLRPRSALVVPCAHDGGVVGALELIDKQGGPSFGFDDLELATLLAGVAASALRAASAAVVPAPAELAGDLARLATADPVRYAAVAAAVTALLRAG
jgi:GAF domain-containing protein